LFIATGTGLAPYMSMIRFHLLEHLDRKLCILHGARNSWELGYKAQLRHLQTYTPNFSYHTVISKPELEPTKWLLKLRLYKCNPRLHEPFFETDFSVCFN
jgi:ferredoxin--NADP+ reductase